MGSLARELENCRSARDDAREVFDTRLAQVREDLEERGIGGRVADRIGEDARIIFEEAIDVADSHRGIVAGTIVAVAIWIFRNPIIRLVEELLGRAER